MGKWNNCSTETDPQVVEIRIHSVSCAYNGVGKGIIAARKKNGKHSSLKTSLPNSPIMSPPATRRKEKEGRKTS